MSVTHIAMTEAACWQAVQLRDRRFDGSFVYAVRTTGVFCRPSCPARRPHRENVEFFLQPRQAERAGFRACRRCNPGTELPGEPQRDRMVAICRYLQEPRESPPTLDELAARFALSPSYLQRVFKRIVGVSPRQFADLHRRERLKARLKGGDSVTDALYNAGYGSSSSFYEQAGESLGMQPVTYRKGGVAMDITYTVVQCRLGYLLVGATDRGICAISLGDSEAALVDALGREFPEASIRRQHGAFGAWIAALLAFIDGQRAELDLPLDIQATAFQRKVWEVLRAIPYGSTRSYRQVAESLGQPTAARAVARACAANPVALAIPCHRVVRQSGDRSGYRWGVARKEALLQQEASATPATQGMGAVRALPDGPPRLPVAQ